MRPARRPKKQRPPPTPLYIEGGGAADSGRRLRKVAKG